MGIRSHDPGQESLLSGVRRELEALLRGFGAGSVPGKLEAYCDERLRVKFYLVDSTRVLQCTLSRLAQAQRDFNGGEKGGLLAYIDQAIDDILREDEDGAASTDLASEFVDRALTAQMMSFGVESARSRRAASRFNRLPDSVRHVFFELVCNGVKREEAISSGLGTASTLGASLRVAALALRMGHETAGNGSGNQVKK